MYRFVPLYEKPIGSPIRELSKHLRTPDMISFAGGMPAADLFDVDGLKRALNAAYENPIDCLQYCPTEGMPSLKLEIGKFLKSQGASCSDDEILVTTGSQQGFDLLLRTLVSPGDVVLVEQPTYPAALQALRLAQAKVQGVQANHEGLDLGELRRILEAATPSTRPKFLYLVPTFSNPLGATMPLKRRLELLQLAVEHQILLIEDDPYSGLRFEGDAIPSLLSLAEHVNDANKWVVHLGSLSKIAAPGLRIGWTVGPSEVVRRSVIAKQTSDLCSSPWMQVTASNYLRAGALAAHVKVLASNYLTKRNALCSALRDEFSDELEFDVPAGGMFVWARLRGGVDASELLSAAVEEKVVFVPGSAFFVISRDPALLRLSFAGPSLAEIGEGVKRLGRAWSQLRISKL